MVTKGYAQMADGPGALFSHVGRMGAPVGARVRTGPGERVATCVTGGEAARRQAAWTPGEPGTAAPRAA